MNLYYCSICNYDAPNLNHLRIHMRIHPGEKQFSCRFCPYRTSKLPCIKRHLKNHDGSVGKYKCPHCCFTVNNNGYFNMHIKLHDDVYQK